MIDGVLKQVQDLAPCYKLEARHVSVVDDIQTVSISVGYYAKEIEKIISGLKVIASVIELEFELIKRLYHATTLEVKITYSIPV